MQRTISRSSSSNNASTVRNTSTTRRRSLPRPPDSLTSALLSSANSVSLLNSNSDVDSTPHTPPSRSAVQYFPSAKLKLNCNTDSASSNFARPTSRCPSSTSKLTNSSYKPSANSRRPLPPPSHRSSGHRTLSVSSKVSLPKPDTSNNNYLVRSAPSSKSIKSPVLSILLSLPPPSYSRHDKFLDSCTSGATKKASNAIVKPNQPPPTKLQPILEFPNISAPAPARAIQYRGPSPLRHALLECNLEDHPPFQTGSFRFEQFRITAASESKKHFGIRKNGNSMMKGTREKISGGKNSKVVRIVSEPPGAEFFIN
ncbi:hypothetical protein GYMLUDRAFT_64745 [Collybiopsis luxurians FD-317 M1]|uniref:Uncharacterized protein n=1 Tax=Collybiopsis luxurians FD-317 M1 TaxID=944289 RepID=A0A0D0BPQ3_9AGAR|nr:hypothetical protein GYMLUDRAFT_64745 [Collybiopsis luxurians FD-317 M1]